MKTLTFLCAKGGVGKTTAAYHSAAGLASRGHRVLLIDADGQGHATRLCNLRTVQANSLMARPVFEAGLYQLLVRDAKWSDVLFAIPWDFYAPAMERGGVMAVLPGNHETMVIPMMVSDPHLLRRRLAELQDSIDVVIIDTSPTPSLLNGLILMATDLVIYPTELEYLSLNALTGSIADAETFSKVRCGVGLEPIRNAGILPTRYRANTVEHQENLKQIMERYRELVWMPGLPQRISWTEATMQRQSVFVYAPNSDASREGWLMVDKVEEAIGNHDI